MYALYTTRITSQYSSFFKGVKAEWQGGDGGLIWSGSSELVGSGSDLNVEPTEFAARSNKDVKEKSCQKRVQSSMAKLCQILLRSYARNA